LVLCYFSVPAIKKEGVEVVAHLRIRENVIVIKANANG
jgi:hypothetical protein